MTGGANRGAPSCRLFSTALKAEDQDVDVPKDELP
jgi:hypothetical protein